MSQPTTLLDPMNVLSEVIPDTLCNRIAFKNTSSQGLLALLSTITPLMAVRYR